MSEAKINNCLQNKINKITDILKSTVTGECTIALAGAHAKGESDFDSDIDFFMFVNELKPFEERQGIIQESSDEGANLWVSETLDFPWGGSMDFTFDGTPVEVTVRTISQTEKRINECLEGQFEIIPQTWTSNGYYSYIYLSELSFIKPIWDPNGFIADYQNLIKIYPSKLKKAIIDCFFARANTWINNFHYSSAIKRMDLLFTGPIVLHTILDIIQVIFALNEKYFTGDKKLEAALVKMPYCPKDLLENLEFLLSAPRCQESLEKQCSILRDIVNDVERVINQTYS